MEAMSDLMAQEKVSGVGSRTPAVSLRLALVVSCRPAIDQVPSMDRPKCSPRGQTSADTESITAVLSWNSETRGADDYFRDDHFSFKPLKIN